MITNRAAALYSLKRNEEALVAYDRALALASPDLLKFLICQKGKTLYFLDRDEEALACFDRVIEINPDDVEASANERRRSSLSNATKKH